MATRRNCYVVLLLMQEKVCASAIGISIVREVRTRILFLRVDKEYDNDDTKDYVRNGYTLVSC